MNIVLHWKVHVWYFSQAFNDFDLYRYNLIDIIKNC